MVSLKACSKLLLAIKLFIGGSNAAAGCNADNCYRALFPCPSPTAVSAASAFCATITGSGITATNYPARATAACGTSADRYISACKCGPTCTPTATQACSTPTAGLIYGDFECGLPAWSTQLPDAAASAKISSPGFTGQKAFEADFSPPSVSNELGVSARLLGPAVPITPGQTYKLTFATWFDIGSSGFTGVMINNKPYRTIDANDFGTGHWHFNQLAWTANATETTAAPKFEFLFGGTKSVDKIDDVVFAPLSATCGLNPATGILPDGEFECGLGSWTAQTPDSAAIATVKSGNAFIGDKAFEVVFTPPPKTPQLGVSARLLSKKLDVIPGTTYLLQFYTFFDNGDAGFIGIQINDQPLYTIDARDKGFGFYNLNEVVWKPADGIKTRMPSSGAPNPTLDQIVRASEAIVEFAVTSCKITIFPALGGFHSRVYRDEWWKSAAPTHCGGVLRRKRGWW
ncbi:hypothetical protein B0J14DRAFT_615374 [Halenospora varia]|nr:hypothetical protein B0J14DRAFT_615374 [Halenospora varia]